MLEILLYALFVSAAFVAGRWMLGLLVQAVTALFSALVSITGTMVVVGGVFYLVVLILR